MAPSEGQLATNLPVDLGLLWEINQAENPGALARLQLLIQQGKTPDEIAVLCNELGHLKYEDADDPNALVNRFRIAGIDRRTIPEILLPELQGTPFKVAVEFDEDYYAPSINSVRRNRELVNSSARIEAMPRLETHDDYINYFNSFHPAVLQELIKNLFAIVVTDGCSGACRKVCIRRGTSMPQSHMPFSVIEWIFENYTSIIRDKNTAITPCSSNDLRDYESNGKTGVDIVKLYQKHSLPKPYLSTVFPKKNESIDFIYELVVKEGIPISRFSRLVTGKDPTDIEWLITKIKQRAEAEGDDFHSGIEDSLRKAFREGVKDKVNPIAGNAIKEDTPESEISTAVINCNHGVSLISGKGFVGVVVRPNSKVFKHGDVIYPINPNDKEIAIPKPINEGSVFTRMSGVQKLVTRPRFTRMASSTGEIIEEDKTSSVEQSILDISELKKSLERLQRETSHNSQSSFEGLDLDSFLELLTRLDKDAMVMLSFAEENAEPWRDLLDKYEDDTLVLIDLLQTIEQSLGSLRQTSLLINSELNRLSEKIDTVFPEPDLANPSARGINEIRKYFETEPLRIRGDLLKVDTILVATFGLVLSFLEKNGERIRKSHSHLVSEFTERTGVEIRGLLQAFL